MRRAQANGKVGFHAPLRRRNPPSYGRCTVRQVRPAQSYAAEFARDGQGRFPDPFPDRFQMSDSPLSPLVEKWKAEQQEMRRRLIVRPLEPLPRFVAGADCAFSA